MSSVHLHKNNVFGILEVGNLLPKLFSFPNLILLTYWHETTLGNKLWKFIHNGSGMGAWIYPTLSLEKGNGKKWVHNGSNGRQHCKDILRNTINCKTFHKLFWRVYSTQQSKSVFEITVHHRMESFYFYRNQCFVYFHFWAAHKSSECFCSAILS